MNVNDRWIGRKEENETRTLALGPGPILHSLRPGPGALASSFSLLACILFGILTSLLHLEEKRQDSKVNGEKEKDGR